MKINFTNDNIKETLFRITNLFFVIGMFCSFNLWFQIDRTIPFISLFSFEYANYLSVILSVFLLGFLLSNIKIRNNYKTIGTLILVLSVLFFDRFKWQPWIYFYSIVLLLFLFDFSKKKVSFFYIIKHLIGVVYVWAGIHKISPKFLKSIELLFNNDYHKVESFFIVFPYLEIIIGLIIIFLPITRLLKHFFIGFHLLIILFVLFTKTNTIIIPWNIYYIIVVVFLYKIDKKKDFTNPFIYEKTIVFFVFFALLPSLNFYSKLDHYFSFSLYSGKIPQMYLLVPKNEITPILKKKYKNSFLVSEKSKRYVIESDNFEVISYYKLSINTLNVPPVMEESVINNIKKECEFKIVMK